MLMRRVTEHIKEQNWFAVALEFLVVVVGILIAFQITEWNEARRITAKQQLINHRLISDFEMLEQASDNSVDRTRKIILSLDALRNAIERGHALPDEDEDIKFALRWGASYSDNMRHSPTYSELISSGQLDLITNEEARVALSQFNQEADSTAFNFRSIHNVMNENYIYVPQYASLHPIDRDSPNISLVDTYDIAAMASDESYRRALKELADFQTWLYSNIESHNRVLKETKKLLEGT